jgi:hypothetical protein
MVQRDSLACPFFIAFAVATIYGGATRFLLIGSTPRHLRRAASTHPAEPAPTMM